jgi:dTMP kinase
MIIAIEGIDGSGKGTQTRLLEKRLIDEGIGVSMFSFPRYSETFFGREVGNYLDGKFGDLENVNPKFSSLLYALDRFETAPQIEEALARGNIVIFDRFIGSNIAHQCARVPKNKVPEMATWIRTVEETILKARKPDIVIFLDININQASELVAKKEKRSYTDKTLDLHEASPDHLDGALANFRYLARTDGWVTVLCNRTDGTIRRPEEIADEIYSHVHHNDDKA